MAGSGAGFAVPILAGGEERWRRFLQKLAGSRREEYEDLRHRLGITGQKVWLVRTRRGATAVSYLECEEPERIVSRLAASTEPFDVWLKTKLAEFHGCGFAPLHSGWEPELVFESREGISFVSEGKPPDETE